MLHSRVLRYIDEVARAGSIRAAGQKLNIAPSAINKHILLLEEEIGEALFERLPRGLRLTPAGEILVAHIRRTIREYSQVESEIRDLKNLEAGELILATMNGLAGGIVPRTVASFCTRHPRLKVSIRVMFAHDVVKSVEAGDADLGLAFNLPATPQLETLWKHDTRLGAVLSPAHPLVGNDSLTLAHCVPYPLIFADRAMRIHNIVVKAFEDLALEVEPVFRSNSIEAMKCLASAGDGIAFLSKFDIAEEERNGSLAYIPIRDPILSGNVISLVQREKKSHGLAAAMFAEDLVRMLKTTAASHATPH